MLTQGSTPYLVPSRESKGDTGVASVVSGVKLKEAVVGSTFIVGGNPASVEAVKYDFHLGDRVLKAEYGQPKAIDAIPEESRYIGPGETVFVLTKERLNLPRNMIATLIPKRKMAHGGISVLGGLSVDPEYKGVLVVGMHNFSSTRYQLRPGRKLIAAMFHVLNEEELSALPVAAPEEITDFPDELVDLISKYKPADLGGLQEQLENMRREFTALKNDLANDKAWRDDFKNDLGEHNKQLGILIDGLKEERDARKEEDKSLRDKLDSMAGFFQAGRWVIGAILFIAGVAITIVGEHLWK